jgi:hypothetical protein
MSYINNPPKITSNPTLEARVDSLYVYDVNATDIDPWDTLQYSIIIGPDEMKIEPSTGKIEWVPSPGQEGRQFVRIGVQDMNSIINQTFYIWVHPNMTIEFIYPKEGDTVKDQLIIQGKFHGPDNSRIEINIYDKNWKKIETTQNFTYTLNTWNMNNGNCKIAVRATWTNDTVTSTEVVKIHNPKETSSISNLASWLIFLLIIILSGSVIYYEIRKGRNE